MKRFFTVVAVLSAFNFACLAENADNIETKQLIFRVLISIAIFTVSALLAQKKSAPPTKQSAQDNMYII